jgi:hypothetical protein
MIQRTIPHDHVREFDEATEASLARPSRPSWRIRRVRANWLRTQARPGARGRTQQPHVAANVGRSRRTFGNTPRRTRPAQAGPSRSG